MKKVLCFIVVTVLIFTCFAVSASAEYSKLLTNLSAQLDQLAENDAITIRIAAQQQFSGKDLEKLALEKAGLTSTKDLNEEELAFYKQCREEAYDELQEIDSRNLVTELGLAGESVLSIDKNIISAILSKAQIEQAQTLNSVEMIYVDEDAYEAAFWRYGRSYNGVYKYQELYRHTDASGEVDWVLLNGEYAIGDWGWLNYGIVGNRLALFTSSTVPFGNGYGIYDVKNDRFCGFNDSRLYDESGFSKSEVIHACDEYIPEGRLLGDIDNDGELSAVDVTIIQRCLAVLRPFPEDDTIVWEGGAYNPLSRTLTYYSDFDRDGEREITDATKLQRYLANLI